MSFIPSADSDFPIQNIPVGVYRAKGTNNPGKLATRIGDKVVDLATLVELGHLKGTHLSDGSAFKQSTLNAFMGMGKAAWSEFRSVISGLFTEGSATSLQNSDDLAKCLIDASEVEMLLPASIGDYTDFYASRYHATNLGIMFRGVDNALQPNWLHLPVGYHGRSSSVVVSGTNLHRPRGQTKAEDAPPAHTPCRLVDFELELGIFVGKGNDLGHPVDIKTADEHIFGFVLMNDWSARDIQKWEYVPLGPFGGKNWGTSISPWVIMREALEPFMQNGPDQSDPQVLPYLQEQQPSAYNIDLKVHLQNETDIKEPQLISHTNYNTMYWSPRQMIAHHSVTGCNMRPGDLMGSGTISGPEPANYGSMIELCWKGTKPLQLAGGAERKFLKDGDEVVITGACHGDGYRIGFGECRGRILPVVE
eukprot:TRINITY_DN4989_c0_g1_i2.p1 TRINITY_DN4989_c0_g1~~TRINITY_DN4989_c0_g1_i2.p1  ORF type:complete len:429 (+),score=111.82 TRINITY_DN4989_c0_g1_i2:30-1289(+)